MEDTIAAIGTALGEGGIGIVRLSGARSEAIIENFFVPSRPENWKNRRSHKLYLGHFLDGINKDRFIDQVLVVIMKGPYSYTGEDVVEINCHGGFLAVRSVLETVLRGGARLAEPGEFTRRAFLNGRLDLAQAEASLDLIRAKSELGLSLAAANLGGKLSREIEYCQGELIRLIAFCEASIDFPEDEIEVMIPREIEMTIRELISRLEKLTEGFHKGRILREGLRVVILGKPNVGKSSLLNTLLGRERAIVTDIPGTTRDVIEELIELRGIPLKLIDTAGIRPTEDLVEQIGVERTKGVLREADLALLVLDAAAGVTANDELVYALAKEAEVPFLILLNKVDLKKAQKAVLDKEQLFLLFPGVEVLEISALSGYGIKELEIKVEAMAGLGGVKREDEVLLTRLRHVQALKKTIDHLNEALLSLKQDLPEDFLAIDLKSAWDSLGEINGKTAGEEILDKIFTEFCIGK